MELRLSNMGDYLEQLRVTRGLSLHELADRTQLSLGLLERLEIGAEHVPLVHLHTVLAALEVSELEYAEMMQIVTAAETARQAQ